MMLAELDHDSATGAIYLSPRLNERGRNAYMELLREAILAKDDEWLAGQLRAAHVFNSHEQRRTKRGIVNAAVPATAAETLAEGEFNRFYIRGLCRVVIDDRESEVEVYRAKHVDQPRAESQARIGQRVNAAELLQSLRLDPRVDNALKIPPGPNSGLSVRRIRSTH